MAAPITFLSVEKKESILSLAKEKLFGKKRPRWPTLERLVEEGVLFSIDLAYALLQRVNEKEAATHAALIALARSGHLCLTKENVNALSPKLAALVEKEDQLPKYVELEEAIAYHIQKRIAICKEIQTPNLDPWLTAEQQKALDNAARYSLSLITGGPGTGKTHTAAQIAKALGGKVLLAAPTGKAASHLGEKVGFGKAFTLHCLLRGDPLDADLIIVDESSMIDPMLFAKLLEAIKEKTTLILMGDVDQLPAVEGGSIFADLIDTNKLPVAHLTRCMRSDRLEILEIAAVIKAGELRDIRNVDLGLQANDIETIYQTLWNFTKERFPKDWIKEMDSFRILSTLRKGPLGATALNAFFYEKFSTKTDAFPILITRNDTRTGLSNGDTGVLQKDKGAYFKERFIPLHELPPYEYAYCISVHKSQGSEYDSVLFLIPEGSESFGREILYTAVTRAKSELFIDGAPDQILAALGRSSRKSSHLIEKFEKSQLLQD